MNGSFKYDLFRAIPTNIRKHAERELKNDPKASAPAKRDELLIACLTMLPWRRRKDIHPRLGREGRDAR